MYKQSQLALTDEDIAAINKKRNLPLWAIGISCIVFDLMFLFVIDDSMTKIFWAICIFDLMMLIPMLIIYKRVQKDLDAGFKYLIQGQFDKKEIRSTGKSSTSYLIFGNEKIIVLPKEYKSVNLGDEVEVIFTAFTKLALGFKKM